MPHQAIPIISHHSGLLKKNLYASSVGVSGSLLIPQEPFELLVRRAIKTLTEPAIKCKDYVQEELLRIANESIPSELSRFASLQKKVSDATSDFIRSGGRPAEEMINNLIECEYDYINYDHIDFIGGSNAVAEVLSDRRGRSTYSVRGDRATPTPNGQLPSARYPPVVMRNLRNPVMESIGGQPTEPGLKVTGIPSIHTCYCYPIARRIMLLVILKSPVSKDISPVVCHYHVDVTAWTVGYSEEKTVEKNRESALCSQSTS